MRPFTDIRVLDFTHVYAGPFASFQLAVMGAEVIKIESPGCADMMRGEGVDEDANEQGLGSSYLFNNQGKKAISLNLDSEEGQAVARRLIASADVLLENYSDGLARFNLSPEQALAINPKLIYCEMSGFGRDNPFAGRPAYDPVIQAASGMMSLNGEADQDFLRVGPPLVDYGTGAQAAFAIASALFQRSQTGKGQIIEVNMLDAALMMMSPLLANAIIAGKTDARSGNVQTSKPGYAVYDCGDEKIMVGAFTLSQHRRLFDALALADLIDLPEDLNKFWLSVNGDILRDAIQSRLANKSASEWELILNQSDVPAARVRDLYEMLVSDQLQRADHSQYLRVEGSSMSAPIAAFRYADGGPELDPHCAGHGEDTEVVLSELGYSLNEQQAMKQRGII